MQGSIMHSGYIYHEICSNTKKDIDRVVWVTYRDIFVMHTSIDKGIINRDLFV